MLKIVGEDISIMNRFSVPAGRRLALPAFLIEVSTVSIGLLHAQPGSLDPTFKEKLTAISAIAPLALQPSDGKWVVGCQYCGLYGCSHPVRQGCVARLQTDGDFDPELPTRR